MGETALTERLAALQSREDESYRAQHEPRACAACDAHHLLAVDGEVVAQHAEAKAEEHHVDAYQPASYKEETVGAELPVSSFHVFLSAFDRRIDCHAEACHEQGNPEQQVERLGVAIDEDADGGPTPKWCSSVRLRV